MPDAAVISSGAASAEQVAKFVARWQASEAAERANYQLFLSELCGLLGVPQPEPTKADVSQNGYVFERDVTFQNPDATTSIGRIDLYKRGCFVLEAKQGSEQATNDDPFELVASRRRRRRERPFAGRRVGTMRW